MGIRVKEVKMEGVKKFAMHLPWEAPLLKLEICETDAMHLPWEVPLLKLEICETGETFYLVQVEWDASELGEFCFHHLSRCLCRILNSTL